MDSLLSDDRNQNKRIMFNELNVKSNHNDNENGMMIKASDL